MPEPSLAQAQKRRQKEIEMGRAASVSEPTIMQVPRDLGLRRWVANVLVMGMVAGIAVFLCDPGYYGPRPSHLWERLTTPLAKLSIDVACKFLQMLGLQFRAMGLQLTAIGTGGSLWFPEVDYELGQIHLLCPMLIVGGIVAAATWDIGWLKKLLIITVAIALPLPALYLIHGFLVALTARLYWDGWEGFRHLEANLAICLTTVVVIGVWMAVKVIVGGKPEEQVEAASTSMARVRPPLLWAATIATCLVMILLLFKPTRIPPWAHGFLIKRVMIAGFAVILAFLAIMLVLAPRGGRRARRWAQIGALIPAMTGGAMAPVAFLLMLVVLAAQDPRAEALCGRPLGQGELKMIERRVLRPLTPIAWLAAGAAMFGALQFTLIVRFRIEPFIPGLRAVSYPAYVLAVAVLAALLGAWEFISTRKQSLWLSDGPLAAGCLGVLSILVLGLTWVWPSHVVEDALRTSLAP